MSDLTVLAAIGCVGLASYAMRAGGFLSAAFLPANGPIQRFLRLAPGNLFIAFVAAGCFSGGSPNVVGSLVALTVMTVVHREWAALIAGFAAAGIVAALAG